MIYLVGLGTGSAQELSPHALGALRRAQRVLTPPVKHPALTTLSLTGIDYEPLPDENPQQIAEVIVRSAQEQAPIAYALPGHPLIAEPSVQYLLEIARTEGVPVRLVPSRSFIEPTLEAIQAVMTTGLQILDANALPTIQLNPHLPQLYYNLSSEEAVATLQSQLLRFYPPEFSCTLVHSAGNAGATEVQSLPIGTLTQARWDILTTLYVPACPKRERRFEGFDGLVDVVASLRAPDGCPWDKEQTHQTLKGHLIEESYEVLEAIEHGTPEDLREELGDLLLQVLMHSQIASEQGTFDIHQVVQQLIEKLVSRHPHVFGEVSAENAEQVLKNWDAIKRQQKQQESILEGVPKAMPALLRALEVSKRAARVGFEWETIQGVMEKLREEEQELQQAIDSGDPQRIASEVGDLLFTVVNIARHAKQDPEECLRVMVDRFTARFQWMERTAQSQGRELKDLTPDEWETLWQQAKAHQV
ncbi:MAG: nucleoside triphosphate pyrophosphohydrolase [Fimbriimonadales bacterium]